MQLISLRLGAMALAGAALVAVALPAPHAAAQTSEGSAVPFDDDGLFSKPTLDPVDMGRRKIRLRHLSEVFMGRIPKPFSGNGSGGSNLSAVINSNDLVATAKCGGASSRSLAIT